MTDNEIIKAIECCSNYNDCDKCNFETKKKTIGCCLEIMKESLAIINRLQADNERLKRENEILSINADTAFQDGLSEAQALYDEQVKSESIKEFAERLKKTNRWREEDIYYIDTLLEEMVGEE